MIIKQDVPNGRGHFCKYKCNLKEINQTRQQHLQPSNFYVNRSEDGTRYYWWNKREQSSYIFYNLKIKKEFCSQKRGTLLQKRVTLFSKKGN